MTDSMTSMFHEKNIEFVDLVKRFPLFHFHFLQIETPFSNEYSIIELGIDKAENGTFKEGDGKAGVRGSEYPVTFSRQRIFKMWIFFFEKVLLKFCERILNLVDLRILEKC